MTTREASAHDERPTAPAARRVIAVPLAPSRSSTVAGDARVPPAVPGRPRDPLSEARARRTQGVGPRLAVVPRGRTPFAVRTAGLGPAGGAGVSTRAPVRPVEAIRQLG
ncbi:hypothetical protein [Streptomyces sp. bgisy153]|uniref:hypothetical protein n=1 Tax=Streptomyces sp. bgisy153 TaxID=3413793 RepID=UPI003D729C15